jgi:hypothetical protein
MAKAYEIGGPSAQSALMTPIFRAYYEEDQDICDPEVLADAAEQASIMSRDEVSVSYGFDGGPQRSSNFFYRRAPVTNRPQGLYR